MTPDEVRELYESYFAADPRRNRGMSIGLPLAQWMARYVGARGALSRVCDLGSGFSSVLFASIAGRVITVDGDPRWLAMTQAELTSRGLTSSLHAVDDAALYRHRDACDLVLMDLGAIPYRKGVGGSASRLEYAHLAVTLLAPDGVLVLDDWHQADYARRMGAWLATQGFTVKPLPETTDEFGRFAALATRGPITQPTRSAERGRFSWLKMETKS